MAASSAAAIVADQGQPATQPAFGGTYVEGVVGGPALMNPLVARTAVDQDVVRLAFSGLTRLDRRGEVVPDLARTFHIEEDGRVWTFEIREDARWHDGVPVDGDDVVYTVGLMQDPGYAGPYAGAFRNVSVERLGPKEVRFTLPDAYGPFGANTTFPLLPAHLLGGVPLSRLAAEPFNLLPVGTGPFQVTDVSETGVTLSANLDFYRTAPTEADRALGDGRTRPWLDRIVLRSFPDPGEALAAMARGELDGVGGISSFDAERARGVPSIRIYSYATGDFTALFLNVRPDAEHVVFRDSEVRQAIAHAIDRGRALQTALDGRGRVADTLVPETSWAYPAEIRKYPYSPEDARALLDAAGWTDPEGDGLRAKDGTSLRFTLTTSSEIAHVFAAQGIVEDLQRVGMQVELSTITFDRLVDQVIPDRDYEAILVGITGSADPDPYPFFHSSQIEPPGLNLSGYATLPIDRALESARRTFEREARRELYEPVFAAMANEVPVVFLYFSDYLYAQHRQVHGLKVAFVVEPTQRFWDVEDWYVRTVPRR